MTLLEKVYDFENLLEAYKNCRRGKRATIGDQKFFTNYPERLLEIQDELKANFYKWGTYREFYVVDPKKRLIMAAPFKDRIVHHAIHRVISPFVENELEDSVCACRIGMGNRYAVLKLKEKLQKLESRYVIKLDVKKYFPSIDHKILFDDLNEVLPDKTLSQLLWTLIQSHNVYKELGRGIPIGNLTSQLFANFYLSKVDKLIVKRLKESHESAFYLRYMDDLLIVGLDKKSVCKTSRDAIELSAQRNLEIPIYKRVHLSNDPIPFLGYLVDSEMVRSLSRNTRKIKRNLNKLEKANVRESYKQMVRLSYANWASLK
jgi:RNA-directed DNA polymerase